MVTAIVPLAAGFEDLEAVTITDLLRRAGVDVITVGLTEGGVIGARGLVVVPDKTLADVMSETFDLIALPGGLPGADNLRDDVRIIERLQHHAEQGKVVAAICAAPKVLAKAGLLEGKVATSYPGVLESLDLPTTTLSDEPVVESGNIITSRGPGTAMDFALALIEKLQGAEARKAVETPLAR